MSMNDEIQNAYNLYNIKNIVTIVPTGNFTSETNNSQSTEQKKNSSAEETLNTAYYQIKRLCKNLKIDWLNIWNSEAYLEPSRAPTVKLFC